MKKLLLVVGVLSSLYGCSNRSSQSFSEIPKEACVVKHEAVKYPEFLEGMKIGFSQHGTKVRIIDGAYTLKSNVWHPTWTNQDVSNCDKMVYYVANWSWDGVMYLRYANIWTEGVGSESGVLKARSTYEVTALGGLGLTKFVNSRNKAIEMVDELYSD